MEQKLPHWVARSFRRHHNGEDGVRRLTAWPPQGLLTAMAQEQPEHDLAVPELVATVGESDVWVFSSSGDALYHCLFESTKVWSVSILEIRQYQEESASTAHADKLQLRMLMGFESSDERLQKAQRGGTLQEHTIIIDDPTVTALPEVVDRKFREVDMKQGRAWGGEGQCHTDTVTGIFVDYPRGLVYTVSYDKSAIQWDLTGSLLSQAKGFHRDKIIHGALSQGGCWLATAGFDHVAVFSTDRQEGLACAALIDHSWDHVEVTKRWFSVAFLPGSLTDEEESTSELPSAIVAGDGGGDIWLVSLLDKDCSRHQPSGLTKFVNAWSGIPFYPHTDCVRNLCWVEADEPPSMTSARSGGEADGGVSDAADQQAADATSSRSMVGQVAGNRSTRTSTQATMGPLHSGDARLTSPLLCSTSSDKTVHVFDSTAIFLAWQRILTGDLPDLSNVPADDGTTRNTVSRSDSVSRATIISESAKRKNKSSRLRSLASSRSSKGHMGAAEQEEIPVALEISFHTGPVRAVGVDAYGRLYTAARRLAQWEGLKEHTENDVVMEPTLVIREAYFLEVGVYFASIFIFALQMLYFTSNRGVLGPDNDDTLAIMLPISFLTALTNCAALRHHATLAVMDWPYWRTVLFLAVTLLVFICPRLLQMFYAAEREYDLDEQDFIRRKKLWRRKLMCYVFVFVFFNLMVVPTFTEFAHLLNCARSADGLYRLSLHPEEVCFRGWHLAFSIAFFLSGGLYLLCGVLFETVNFNLRSLLESRLGCVAAFPPNSKGTGRNVTARRLLYVMFRHLAPDLGLHRPKANLGAFTETDWSNHSRQIRFLSKVLLAACDKLESSQGAPWQLTATTVIAAVNLLVNLCAPPLVDSRLMKVVYLVMGCCTVASAISLSATAGPAVDAGISREVHAVAYVCVVCLPPLLCLIQRPCSSTWACVLSACRRKDPQKRVRNEPWERGTPLGSRLGTPVRAWEARPDSRGSRQASSDSLRSIRESQSSGPQILVVDGKVDSQPSLTTIQ